MPANIHCPQCRLLLQLPDQMLGKKVKCSACQAVFTAQADEPGGEIMTPDAAGTMPPPPPESERPRHERDDDDRPRRPRRYEEESTYIGHDGPPPAMTPEEKASWRIVAFGLSLQSRAHYVYAGAVFLLLVFSFAAGEGGGPGFAGVLFGFVSTLALLVSLVVSVLAASHFLSATPGLGARPLAITLLVLSAVGLLRVSGMFTEVLAFREGGFGAPGPMALGFFSFLLVEMARLTLLPFFIRAIARNLNLNGLAAHAFVQMIAVPAGFGFMLLLFLVTGLARSSGLAIAIMVLNTLIYIGLLVWQALLCHFAGRGVAGRTPSDRG